MKTMASSPVSAVSGSGRFFSGRPESKAQGAETPDPCKESPGGHQSYIPHTWAPGLALGLDTPELEPSSGPPKAGFQNPKNSDSNNKDNNSGNASSFGDSWEMGS